MRVYVAILAFVLAADPAAAEVCRNFSPEGCSLQRKSPERSGVYGQPAQPSTPRPPSVPSNPGGFKPYEPYKGSSVYGSPKRNSSGARDCELSVYTNACGR